MQEFLIRIMTDSLSDSCVVDKYGTFSHNYDNKTQLTII